MFAVNERDQIMKTPVYNMHLTLDPSEGEILDGPVTAAVALAFLARAALIGLHNCLHVRWMYVAVGTYVRTYICT